MKKSLIIIALASAVTLMAQVKAQQAQPAQMVTVTIPQADYAVFQKQQDSIALAAARRAVTQAAQRTTDTNLLAQAVALLSNTNR